MVKGSPEAIGALLAPGTAPIWYDSYYKELARKGLRVLSLAYKKLEVESASSSGAFSSGAESPENRPRDAVESNLIFCGFIAFECKIRADSPVVIRCLITFAIVYVYGYMMSDCLAFEIVRFVSQGTMWRCSQGTPHSPLSTSRNRCTSAAAKGQC